MKGARMLFLASWVLLLLVSALTAFVSLDSLRIAYFGHNDDLSRTVTLEQIRNIGGDDAVTNYKGRRATAATWALGYALLTGLITFFSYRRGERWAWWALFISITLTQLLSLGRVFTLGTTFGTGTAGAVLAFYLLGLVAGVPRIFFNRDPLL
jgi:SNF family Na+-dependent transporter